MLSLHWQRDKELDPVDSVVLSGGHEMQDVCQAWGW